MVKASAENSKKIYKSLSEFGASLFDITEKAFAGKGVIFQIGVAPRRIDIITHIAGDFEDLKKNKKASGIYQDLADLENMEIN